jgi:two-component system, NtrC family, response regulator AtoC
VTEESNRSEIVHRLLIVDDEESIRVSLAEALADDATEVMTASNGRDALAVLGSEVIDLILLDQKLKESGEDGIEVLREVRKLYPDVVTIMMTAYGRFESAVEATKLGSFQYITKPLDVNQLKLLIASALSTSQLRREVEILREQQERVFSPLDVFGSSQKIRDLLDHVRRAAASPTSTVLIHGETGVGKELVARQIHTASPVGGGPFVDFNVSAVPENLIESELFGYDKGAFTDAKGSKRGLFEMADRGSLFLDEIAEMPQSMQAKLLRVLETKSFRRLGSTVDVKVQVRVIAATNKDLFQEVEAGRFREDLYYRLDVIPVSVPPLRDRKDDIPVLARHFLERFRRELGRNVRTISAKAMDLMVLYAWPGNVRELRNLMERMVLMTTGDEILPEHLPQQILAGAAGSRGAKAGPAILFPLDQQVTLQEVEIAAITHTLSRVGGNKTKAAEILGISRQTLRSKLREGGIEENEAASF